MFIILLKIKNAMKIHPSRSTGYPDKHEKMTAPGEIIGESSP